VDVRELAEHELPNFNSNLVVLKVWHDKSEGIEDTAEFPIIAWRIVEGDLPVAISTDGEMSEPDNFTASMVFDRAMNVGTFQGGCVHSREDCIKELHRVIEYEQRRTA
jgi:hypothetical protein